MWLTGPVMRSGQPLAGPQWPVGRRSRHHGAKWRGPGYCLPPIWGVLSPPGCFLARSLRIQRFQAPKMLQIAPPKTRSSTWSYFRTQILPKLNKICAGTFGITVCTPLARKPPGLGPRIFILGPHPMCNVAIRDRTSAACCSPQGGDFICPPPVLGDK